jgi:hypothetical protein
MGCSLVRIAFWASTTLASLGIPFVLLLHLQVCITSSCNDPNNRVVELVIPKFIESTNNVHQIDNSIAETTTSGLLNSLTYSLSMQQTTLHCLSHRPRRITGVAKAGADPKKTLLEHQTFKKCGKLHRQWLNNPPLSEYAQAIDRHQSNCTLPLAKHHFDNTFGLGSHLLLWGQVNGPMRL